MMPKSRRAFSICTFFLLLTIASGSLQGQSALNGHTVRLDSGNKLLAWSTAQGDAYDQVLSLAANYLLTSVPKGPSGLPYYYTYSYAYPGNPVSADTSWPHNPAGLFSMLTDSGLRYYAYSGNAAAMNLVRDILTFQLDHGMTPSSWNWGGVAYASADAGSQTYQGAHYGDSSGQGDGNGVIQPDKVGEIGVAFLQYYQFSGVTRFRDAAIQAADVLANHIRAGDATHSPWPFRVYAQTNVIREQYSAHVISPIRLFDELSRLNLGNVSAYQAARQTAWDWLMAYPIKNNVWSNYFEDVAIQSDLSNVNQLNAGETARYLMQHPEFDSSWETHVRGIIKWIETTFGKQQYGANIISEQYAFVHPMGSHTSRYASINAQLYELTGDQTALEKAYRSFNWATYMCSTNGVVIDGPEVNHVWWTDGYGDYIKHFLEGLGSAPQWAPQSQSHLLRSTSVVRSIQYAATDITYQVADESSREVLRINFDPDNVTVDGSLLASVSDLNQEGWTYDAGTGVLRIRHDTGTQIHVSGSPAKPNLPPDVSLDTPSAGTYDTTSLSMSATASDPDGAIDHVEFRQNGALLASVASAPYTYTWSSIAAGTYQLTAVAVDNVGARTTSAAVPVTITAAQATPPPTNLVATTSGTTINLAWQPPTGGASSYRVYRSGASGFTPADTNQIGTSPNSSYADGGLGAGTYYYRVVANDGSGNPSQPSNEASATIAGGFAVDKVVFSDGTSTRTSPAISTSSTNTLLLALAASDGPSSGQTLTISGGGLTWTRLARVTTQNGSSEIWKATAASRLTNATVTSTQSRTGYHQSLTVITFANAAGTGAVATNNASSGAPTVSLTTTKAGSLVYGVGNDWSRASARTIGPSQTMVHQWVDTSAGDTFWVQSRSAPAGAAGSVVQLNDSAPTSDRWNFAAVEVLAGTTQTYAVVPDVVGESQSAAQSMITSAGLSNGTVTGQSSATVPSGSVISQTPAAAAQVPSGTTVAIVVSTGPQFTTVPNVLGLPQTTAQVNIEGAGLAVGAVSLQSSASVPPGSVLAQNPAGGSQVPAGSDVSLTISAGVAVPNVVGQTQSAAQTAINNAGLTVGAVTTQASASVPSGSVISQNPSGGSQVAGGSAVSIVVSSGTQQATVPDVAGQSQSAAQSLISNAGLTVGTVTNQASDTVPTGNVISQTPIGGTQVAAGSAVNLVVSSGSTPVGAPTVDRTIFSDGAGARTTSRFSTTAANELLVAFVAADGPSNGSQTATVSGAGLTWTLVRRANTQHGTSEIWSARAANVLTNVTITSTLSSSSFRQSLTVVTFTGATRVGTSVAAGGATGAPSLSFSSSAAHTLVYAVGNDWDRATSRTLGTGQTMVHQVVDTSVGDTFWVQARATEVASAGVLVQMNSTAPTSDRWNLAAVEIVP